MVTPVLPARRLKWRLRPAARGGEGKVCRASNATAGGRLACPIPRRDNEALFKRYDEMAQRTRGVTFVGRLAQYRYDDMDQVVAALLKAAEDLLTKELSCSH